MVLVAFLVLFCLSLCVIRRSFKQSLKDELERCDTVMAEWVASQYMHDAVYTSENDLWYGEIPTAPGVWATGATEKQCKEELRSVLKGWIEVRKKYNLRCRHDINH